MIKFINSALSVKNQRNVVFAVLIYVIFVTYISDLLTNRIGVKKEIVEDVAHIYVVILTILVGTLLDRGIIFAKVNTLLERELKANSDQNFERTRSQLIPMIREFGISAVHEKIQLSNIVSCLSTGDHIDILFTYHPEIGSCLPALIEKVKNHQVQCRMLLGSPSSEAVKRRFSYIHTTEGIIFDTADMPNQLSTFFDQTVPNQIKLNRDFSLGKYFQLRSFNLLPDIPLIIISEADEISGTRVKRVLQGYYLNKPAIELPFVEWVSVADRDPKIESMALLISQYFESRWINGVDLGCVTRVAE